MEFFEITRRYLFNFYLVDLVCLQIINILQILKKFEIDQSRFLSPMFMMLKMLFLQRNLKSRSIKIPFFNIYELKMLFLRRILE